MNFNEINKPIFSNGEMLSFDENNDLTQSKKIDSVEAIIEYPEERLGTIELLRVDLFDKNKQIIFQDNDIINHSVYHKKDHIRKDLIEKYEISPTIITFIE